MLLVFLILLLTTCGAFASDKDGEILCMARNIYFESGNQPLAGKIAVAHVVINRRDNKLFPNTICKVITQGGEKRNRCQFSWYCDGKPDSPTDSTTWLNCYILASNILSSDRRIDITEGSLWYHADYVKPYWASQLAHTVTIGNHLFYK
jgi:spore germination cell wall hydrolase CwlJ-like protein